MDEARLCGVEHHMTRMMCGVRLVVRVSTNVLRDRVGVSVKDMIIESRLRWYDHVMHGDTNSQIRKVIEVEITGKWKIGQPKILWE